MSKKADKFKPSSSGYSPRKTKGKKTQKTFLIVCEFEFLDTGKDAKYCGDRVKNLLGFDYDKEGLYDQLIDKQNSAIKNAKKLLSQYENCNPVEDNPSTTVHLLVEELNKASSDN